MDAWALKERFQSIYNRAAAVLVRAPGRVNLIGEHTDYNDGFVLPIAIERHITAAIAPRDDRKVTFNSLQISQAAAVDLVAAINPAEPIWANYCRGVVTGLLEAGVKLSGADVLFDSGIPIGAGLGSSGALEVCTALALLEAAGKTGELADRDLIAICQRAAHEFAGAPCGIMDQSISLMGRKGCALLLDCRSGDAEYMPFDDPGKSLLVVDTKVKHDNADGKYARRRRQCESAAAKLGAAALRDADQTMISAAQAAGTLSIVESRRATHVVSEIARTLEAADALRAGDYVRFGELMYASHESLRSDFEVSCDELDAVVETARSCSGVYGARMTGGGFGGCAIVLVDASQAKTVGEAIEEAFQNRFGRACEIFTTRASAGAEVMAH